MKDNKKLSKIDNYKIWEIAFEINNNYIQILKIYNKHTFLLYMILKKLKGLMSMRANKLWVIGNQGKQGQRQTGSRANRPIYSMNS